MCQDKHFRNARRSSADEARPCAGFTLLETLLAIALVVVLAGVSVIGLVAWSRSSNLTEGADRLETTIRMARAEASLTGKRIQLSFDEAGSPRLLWEAEPFEQPGVFTDYTACTWTQYIPVELVRVVRSDLTGPSAYRTLFAEQMSDQASLAAITFYSDGSSDSAVIEFVAADDSDTRMGRIEIDGINQTILSQLHESADGQ